MGIERTKQKWNGWGWVGHRNAVPADQAVWRWLAAECGMPALLATPPRSFEDIALPPSALSAADLRMLAATVDEGHVRISDYERVYHAHGRSLNDLLRLRSGAVARPPDAVVYPADVRQAMLLLKLCEHLRIAAVPFGGGTNLDGSVAPRRGGFDALIAIDTTLMDRVSDIDTAAMTATAQAGISGARLESVLAEKGVMFGHAPYSFEFSTLGGWIAQDGFGLGVGSNGLLRDRLIDVRMATPVGLLGGIDYALGSGGSLGLICEARLRLRPLPERREVRAFVFPDFAAAASAIRVLMHGDLPPASIRLSDAAETRLFLRYAALTRQPGRLEKIRSLFQGEADGETGACLTIATFEGGTAAAEAAMQSCDAVARKFGGRKQKQAMSDGWPRTRFLLPYLRDLLLDRGLGAGLLSAAIPWRRLDAQHQAVTMALDAAMRQDAPHEGAHGLVLGHIAHAAPQCAHMCYFYIYPRTLDDEIAQAERIEAAGRAALAAEDAANRDAGANAIAASALKTALDPCGILHPGKPPVNETGAA